MTHVLEIKLDTAVNDSVIGEPPSLRVDAVALVDGKPLVRNGYFFDVGLILALAATSLADVYPFTCSCGVPGCIGVFEPAQIEATDSRVIWTLPREPFGDDVPDEFLAQSGPVRVEFDRAQYEAAVEAATAHLEEISAACGRHLDIWPGAGGPNVPVEEPYSLRAELAAVRERVLDDAAHQEWRVDTWGEFLGHELVLEMGNGLVWFIPFENLAYVAVGDGYSVSEAAQEVLENDIAPRLKSGTKEAIAVAKSIEWPHLVEHLFRDDATPKDVDGKSYAALREWPEDIRFSQRAR